MQRRSNAMWALIDFRFDFCRFSSWMFLSLPAPDRRNFFLCVVYWYVFQRLDQAESRWGQVGGIDFLSTQDFYYYIRLDYITLDSTFIKISSLRHRKKSRHWNLHRVVERCFNLWGRVPIQICTIPMIITDSEDNNRRTVKVASRSPFVHLSTL